MIRKSRKMRSTVYSLVLVLMLTFLLPFYNMTVSAETHSSKVEKELKTLISDYGEENVVFEDGIYAYVNEEISTSNILSEEKITWTSKDESILKVEDQSTLVGIKEGTTFLIGEVNGKYHIQEVYVAPSKKEIALFNVNNIDNDVASINDIASAETIKSNILQYSSQYVVYIDPGHGGTDPGALGNGLKEKDLTLSISLKVKRLLEASGVKVIMSRETDRYVSLQERSNQANSSNTHVFVSIHINSVNGAPTANGIETYYYKGIDKALADSIHPSIISTTGATNRKVKYANHHVTRETIMPASLVECGFISNAAEASKMNNNNYQELLASGVVNGTVSYLQKNVVLEPEKPEGIFDSERIFGNDRYETSYKVFEKGWTSSQNLVIVSGLDYPDALCAAPLAGKYDAPIVLSKNASLKNQQDLLNLIKTKGVKNVFIVGGSGVIPTTVEQELSELGITHKRLGGNNRYETSVAIADEVGVTGDIAVTYGMGFADGISFSPIAAKKRIPILLVNTNSIPKETSDFLNRVDESKTYVIGGSGIISDNIVSSLTNSYRLGGIDRYATNKEIFDRFKGEMTLSDMFIASGLDYPDALAASALAGKKETFVILSHPSSASSYTKEMVNGNKDNLKNFYILGGNQILSNKILDALGIKY